jgi:hypothetical protein
MTHGICIGYDSFGDESRLWRMLDYALTKKELWISTFHDVAAYTKERDNISLVIKKKEDAIKVIPKLQLDPSIFNMPLTMVLRKKPVTVIQHGNQLAVHASKEQFYFDFNPFNGDIFISFK